MGHRQCIEHKINFQVSNLPLFLFQTAQDAFSELDAKLFEAYVEEKSNPILGMMEHNMYRGGFDWKTCQKPKGKLFLIHVIKESLKLIGF